MWYNYDLLRLSYMPTIIIPLLMAVFSNDLTLLGILPAIVGWSFLLISANLINDYIDKDRKLQIGGKSLLGLAAVLALFGLFILKDKLFYAVPFVILINIYNSRVKGIHYVDVLFLTMIFVLLPYFSVAEIADWNLLAILILGGFTSTLIDKIVDEPKYAKIKNQAMNFDIGVVAVAAVFVIYMIAKMFSAYSFLLPLVPINVLVLFGLCSKKITVESKVVGVYTGVALMFYLIVVLIEAGKLF